MTDACSDFRDDLWDLLDGVLPDDRADALQHHADACSDCATAFDDARRLHSGLESISQAPLPTTPTAIGSYRIVRRIGAGGMGVVYEAEQPSPRRTVAVKVLRPDSTGNDALIRAFRREIEALGRLRHPSIATVHDAGRTDDGQLYFVMEAIAGRTLAQYCSDEDSSRTERIELIARIADGIQYAHDQGIVHCDLKPANVLVEDGGTPRLVDFGLARFVDPLHDVTHSQASAAGAPAGTLAYISPERLLGERATAHPRDDIYALGVMLYELLSGSKPYPVRPSMSALDLQALVASREPTDLRAVVSKIPRPLADVVMQAVARDPERRYATASDLAADLRAWLDGGPVSARHGDAVYRARAVLRRHRRSIATATAAAAVTAITLVFLTQGTPTGAVDGARFETTQFEIPGALPNIARRGRLIDFDSTGRRALHVLAGKQQALATWTAATGVSHPLEVDGYDRWNLQVARWSPDDQRVAALATWHDPADNDHDTAILVLDPDGSNVARLAFIEPFADRPRDLCWSADGSFVTCTTFGGQLVDVDLDGEVTPWPTRTDDAFRLGGYTGNGRWLLLVTEDEPAHGGRDAWIVPADGTRPAQRIDTDLGRVTWATWSADERSIWLVGTPPDRDVGNVYRVAFDASAGRAVGAPEQVTFHDNGRIQDLDVFTGRQENTRSHGEVQYRRIASYHEIYTTTSPSVDATTEEAPTPQLLTRGSSPTLSEDGDLLYFVESRLGRMGLSFMPTDRSREPVQLAGFEPMPAGRKWTYDVRRDGAITIGARDADGFGVFLLDGDPLHGMRLDVIARTETLPHPGWDADGRRIVWISDRDLAVFDVATRTTHHIASPVWEWLPDTLRCSPTGVHAIALGYASPAEKADDETIGLYLADFAAGTIRRLPEVDDKVDYIQLLEWHPSGTWFHILDGMHNTYVCHLDGRPLERLTPEQPHITWAGTWHPDGRTWWYYCMGGPRCSPGMHVLEFPSRRLVHPVASMGGIPTWSGDGSRVVWAHEEQRDQFERLSPRR